jgi:molybdopterin synthase sulfur carrier subunit
MIIKFFAFFRDYTGTKETSTAGSNTLKELLDTLCAKYGKRFTEKVFSGDKLGDDIIILVNGRHIDHLQGLDTILSENDEISIFPKVAGG